MFNKLIETTVWDVPTPNLTYVTNQQGHLVAYQKLTGEWETLTIALKQFSTSRRKFKKSKHPTLEEAITC